MKKALWAACSLLGTLASSSFGDEPKIERKPLNIGAVEEFGSVVKGVYRLGEGDGQLAKNDWVDHFGAFLNREAIVNDRLHLTGGLGGIFEFRKPEIPGLTFQSLQYKAFFIGPTQTEAVLDIGEIGNPWLKIGVGLFPYKYNPEAVNLGEYLFRSGAYPTFNTTGGYLIANSAAAWLQGFKANFRSGNFKADLLLFTETGLAPLYDWSLAGVASYSIGQGLLDIGAGFNLQHLLSVRPSRTAARVPENSYFEYQGVKYSGGSSFYSRPASFYTRKAEVQDSIATVYANDADPGNDGLVAGLRSEALRNHALAQPDSIKAAIVDSLSALPEGDPGKPVPKYYTAKAALLMARATLDLKKLFASEAFGSEDLKLYGEIDVLGVQNYPVFYSKITERMPIMFGFNVPCFKILDLLAVQYEIFNSPWMNNTYQRGHQSANIPYFPGSSDTIMSVDTYNDGADKDNVKWSVLLKKNIFKNLTFSAQAASDHMRLTSAYYYYGPQFDHNEVTAFKNHWYWMTQLSWGI